MFLQKCYLPILFNLRKTNMDFLNWLKRINIFFKERYFPIPYIIASFLNTYAIYSITSSIIPTLLIDTATFLLITFNIFSFPLLMRICDEYKDLHSDLIHFPDRCIPRGAVKIKDIIILGSLLLAIFITLNSTYLFATGKSLLPLLGLIIYLYAFLKYFFFPKQVSENLTLALIVSNPITYCLSLYNLYLLILDFSFSKNIIFISLLFWIPSWVWEIARKIKTKTDETSYQTYSRYLGITLSCLIPVIGIFMIALIINNFSSHLQFHLYYQLTVLLLAFIYGLYMIFFIVKPTRTHSQHMQKTTELILFLFLLVEISFRFMK